MIYDGSIQLVDQSKSTLIKKSKHLGFTILAALPKGQKQDTLTTDPKKIPLYDIKIHVKKKS